MWATLRPWLMAALVGYGLCAAFVSSCVLLPLLLVPAMVNRLAVRPALAPQRLVTSVRSAVLVLPALLVHWCASALGWLVALAFELPRSGLIPLAVIVLAGPLALPWVGVLAYAGEPLRVAGSRVFDRWDERGALAWLGHGLVLGAILGAPFLVFALGDGVLFLDEPLLALAGVALVPASIGLAARHAVLETRKPPSTPAPPLVATATVVVLGTLAPVAGAVFGWSHADLFITASMPEYAVFFGAVGALPLIGLAVAASRREPNRPVRIVQATTRGALSIEPDRLVALEAADLVLDDGTIWALAQGESLASRFQDFGSLPSGARVDVCLHAGAGEGVFRDSHTREAFLEIRPAASATRHVRRAQGGWLALAHGAMLVVSVYLWPQLHPMQLTDRSDEDLSAPPH